ncbi:hypothetical protein [Candidatus Macondimonas diazotrophica]|jgi:hypothetical protein|uniref:Uncharacterized protein n=1 Tax=Candidatus Macondimonas diazotrophica TaxID=2305248 RepID=A0A4Z0F7Y9_9GAMM|nr:hypothetical protein [Candidatus Macondimonas diazotrophica]TFZ81590.1 hypothetical protein E4680_11860 [Candidatus Macondimonas diazotrophica]
MKLHIDAGDILEDDDDLLFEEIKDEVRVRVQRNAELLSEFMLDKTPVWTGEQMVNFNWSWGTPDMSYVETPFEQVEGTNQMLVGTEPNYGKARRWAEENFDRISFANPFDILWVTNTAPHFWEKTELGLPPAPGMRARAPAGVFRVSILEVEAQMRSERLI